jgi:thiol-disulfide isomerase/thioredoxin
MSDVSAQRKQPSTSAKQPSGSSRTSTQRVAAARARQAVERRRRRLLLIGVPVLAIVLVIGIFIVVKATTDEGSPKSGAEASQAPTSLTDEVTSVPAETLDRVGAGTGSVRPNAIDAPPSTQDGKPLVTYVGAEYCPYCAAQRWPLAVALSRFGTLSDLGETTSSANDIYPRTPTLSFHGAKYDSPQVALDAKELASNEVIGGKYAPLDTLNAEEQKLFDTYNAPPYVNSTGSIPFLDIGNKYVMAGSSFDPRILQGKTHAQIAAALADPNSPIAQAVDGSANTITAAICNTTKQQPANVCNSAGVTAAAAELSSGQ